MSHKYTHVGLWVVWQKIRDDWGYADSVRRFYGSRFTLPYFLKVVRGVWLTHHNNSPFRRSW